MKKITLEDELVDMLKKHGPLPIADIEETYRSERLCTHADHTAIRNTLKESHIVYPFEMNKMTWYSADPLPPEGPDPPDPPDPPPTKEEIMWALDTLEDMGESGVRYICDGYPPRPMEHLLNGYRKDVLQWVRVVREIAKTSSGSR